MNQFSDFTNENLSYYDQRIINQRKFIDDLYAQYYATIDKGYTTSAYDFRRRSITPAEATLEQLKSERAFIIKSMEGEQSVEFNDRAFDAADSANEPQQVNWTNIGLVVGAVVLIVVVYKII